MAARVQLGSDCLQAAQDAKGLSNERLARELHISEKTWRRWKQSGEVPVYHLDSVADSLNLEIERPTPIRIARTEAQELRQDMAELREMLEELLRRTA